MGVSVCIHEHTHTHIMYVSEQDKQKVASDRYGVDLSFVTLT